jgi:hypothetical protein
MNLGYEIARHILGNDFINPWDIVAARGLAYTPNQYSAFAATAPDEDALAWCRDNGMMLVAGPPKAMSLIGVRAVDADFFYSKGPEQDDSGWYDDPNERFAKTDKVEALTWIAFRKEPVEDSLNKTWPEQQALVKEPMVIPNAAEATWALTTYKAVRDIYLLDELYVRTSSVDSDGGRVYVGDFDADGLVVDGYWDGFRDSNLGVSASRKF